MVKYTVKKARDQVAEGRHFLVENPAGSQAWQDVPEMKELCEDKDVYSVVVDMCQFGLRGPGGGLHKKATRLLTSSKELYEELNAVPRCSGNHLHEHVMGGSRVTELAGHYTQEFSEAVIRGAQKEFDLFLKQATEVMVAEQDEEQEEIADPLPEDPEDPYGDGPDQVHAEEIVPLMTDGVGDPTPEQRRAVLNLHQNTGHRHPLRLARALGMCGAEKTLIKAAKELR